MLSQEHNAELSADVAAAVNKQILNNASRVEICAFFAQECIEILGGLSWLPQHLQEAKKSFEMAKLYLVG